MTTNDFMKVLLPVAGNIIKDMIIGKEEKPHGRIDIDRERTSVDVAEEPNAINVNVNIYMNIYTGLSSNTTSMGGKNYKGEY